MNRQVALPVMRISQNITLIATGVPEIGKQASNPSSIGLFKKFNRLNCAPAPGPVALL